MSRNAPLRPAQHVLSFWGQEASVDDVLSGLRREEREHSGAGISTLNVGHNPLIGRRVRRLLDFLTEEGRKETLPPWALRAMYAGAAEEGKREDEEVPRRSPYRHSLWAIRTLNINRCDLDSAALRLVGEYVRDNGALVSLSVSGNDFESRHEDGATEEEVLGDIISFTSALRYSNISKLSLSSKVGIRGVIAFAQHLHSASLVDLELTAMWTAGSSASGPEAPTGLHAARAVAGLLISQRCPRLQTLKSNANDYGWRGRRCIIGAVVGSDACHDDKTDTPVRRLSFAPSRTITLCELYGTVDYDATPPRSPEPQVVNKPVLLEPAAPAQQAEWLMDADADVLEDEAFASVGYEEPNEALLNRLHRNRRSGKAVRLRAAQILRVARVLGCCATSKDRENVASTPPSFAFASLPPEVRLMILRELDPERTLSDAQFERVVSWACERATIGAGTKDLWQGSAEHGFDVEAQGDTLEVPPDARTTGLLPSHKWSWPHLAALCARSPGPRSNTITRTHHTLPGTLPCSWVAASFDDHPLSQDADATPLAHSAGLLAFTVATATRMPAWQSKREFDWFGEE